MMGESPWGRAMIWAVSRVRSMGEVYTAAASRPARASAAASASFFPRPPRETPGVRPVRQFPVSGVGAWRTSSMRAICAEG